MTISLRSQYTFQTLKEDLLTNWNLIKRSDLLPRKKLLDLYVKVIVPSLTYAIPIWGYATNKNETSAEERVPELLESHIFENQVTRTRYFECTRPRQQL